MQENFVSGELKTKNFRLFLHCKIYGVKKGIDL